MQPLFKVVIRNVALDPRGTFSTCLVEYQHQPQTAAVIPLRSLASNVNCTMSIVFIRLLTYLCIMPSIMIQGMLDHFPLVILKHSRICSSSSFY